MRKVNSFPHVCPKSNHSTHQDLPREDDPGKADEEEYDGLPPAKVADQVQDLVLVGAAAAAAAGRHIDAEADVLMSVLLN